MLVKRKKKKKKDPSIVREQYKILFKFLACQYDNVSSEMKFKKKLPLKKPLLFFEKLDVD